MFTEELWQGWVEQESSNYKEENGKRKYLKKGYLHFDNKFWFPERKEELKKLFQNKLKIFRPNLQRIEYWSFAPFLKILLKTPRYRYQELDGLHDLETKIRPICFASHFDSLIFSFYSYCLTRKYEEYIKESGFQECVLAYRSDLGKCNIQFAKEVFDQVKKRRECTAIALDIKGYFDNIDHETLKGKWQKILGGLLPEDQYKIYKILTKYSYVNKNSFLKKFKGLKKRNEKLTGTLLDLIDGKKGIEKFQQIREAKLVVNNKQDSLTNRFKGIPQGSALSALLSNIYLIDYDKEMYEKGKLENFKYYRYCDDILIICDTNKSTELKKIAINKIAESPYYLTIQDKKVETIDFKENSQEKIRSFKRNKNSPNDIVKTTKLNEKIFYKPLQYLGFEFNGQNTFIRSSSLSRYFRKMRLRINKTVSMAYGASGKSDKVFLQQIFERYSHLGERNFITYGYNASKEYYRNGKGSTKDGMNSLAIKKQLSRHFTILKNTLVNKNEQRITIKNKTNKPVKRKLLN